MNPEFKAIWTAALRSGEYVQGRGALRRTDLPGPDEFCCLGVASEEAAKLGMIQPGKQWSELYEYDGMSSFMPAALSELLDIGLDARSTLMSMNDSDRCTFSEIADWIDENL